MARAVPRHAWPFAAIFLMQIGDMAADALRVVPYIKYELLKRAKVASDASLAESLEPEDADLGAPAGWEAFALLVGATFACISPFTCAVSYLYFVAAYEAGKHALCCLETMPFDTRGALWFDGVAQTHTALFIALVVQLVVLWFNFTNKGFWPVIGGIPILLMWKRYRDRCRRRHATRNLHGLARGRMPLRDGNVVDALSCVEINQCVGCTRQFFAKPLLGDGAAVLARSNGEERAPPRYRAGVASMAWRTTRRFSTNVP